MKTTLILSTLTVLSVVSTAVLAQNFPTTYGNGSAIISTVTPAAHTFTVTPPSSAFTTSDRGYVERQLRRHRVRASSGH
jgi:hypothetical protein